jgi:hypothetical protein
MSRETKQKLGGVAVWTLITIGVLLGAQEWHRSYNAIRHGFLDASPNTDLDEWRAGQIDALSRGRLPIDRAMEKVARTDRAQLAQIQPERSSDPGPAAGWQHHPRFEAPPVDLGEPPPPPPPPVDPASVDPAAVDDAAPVPSPAPAPVRVLAPAPTPAPAAP